METATSLAQEQRRTLATLKRLQALDGFYLAGGGAVAYHLQHRCSDDIDLFSLDSNVDLEKLSAELSSALEDAETVRATDAVLKLRIGGASVDIVRYPYPPLEPPVAGPAGFLVAGLLDLATMKLSAISTRGIRRDFWDLHEILSSSPVTLDDALAAYVRRFGVAKSDLYHVLRSLTYFGDADTESRFPEGLTAEHWHQIKRFFFKSAPEGLRNL